MFPTDDTIVALSSAAGPAGRSIVRLSGPAAVALAGGLFAGLEELGGFRCRAGLVELAGPFGPVAAPARAYVFRAPRSYTRQDVVELHLLGEVLAGLAVLALQAAGARPAGPGEFTARAFVNGRLDLASAAAVADIIDAQADAQLRSAVGIMEGALAKLCRPAKDQLTEALALAEASIDLADEHIELCPPAELARRLEETAGQLEEALRRCGRWTAASAQPRVAIAGAPNVGKSSLLNALSGLDRAIVSALAGTTRDVLSAPAKLAEGLEVLLLDAAGLDGSADPLARSAQAAARAAVASSEAVLLVADLAGDLSAQAQLLNELRALNSRAQAVLAANKTDLAGDPAAALAELSGRLGLEALPVSALTGAGLERLRAALAGRLQALASPRQSSLLLHQNQRANLQRAAAAARAAAGLLCGAAELADRAELVALELRAGLDQLAELAGQLANEDLLGEIFRRFCVGK